MVAHVAERFEILGVVTKDTSLSATFRYLPEASLKSQDDHPISFVHP